MKLARLIEKNIERMQEELDERYWRTSASQLWFRKVFHEVLEEHAGGKLLDAGAGKLLYRPMLERYCETYESLDIEGEEPDYRQDIQDMELDSGKYDTVFCRNVLEHVEEPGKALEEIARVLRDGGKAVISVPHLAYLHNEPEDYYRFTEHGLRHLVEKAGMEVVEIRTAGGLFSFLAYSFSTVFLGLTYNLPLLSRAAYYLNYVVQGFAMVLDRLTGSDRYFSLNYVAVVEK